MTTNRVVQQVDITGGVTRKFTSSLGRANAEMQKISDSLAEQRRRQAQLQAQIDKADGNDEELAKNRRQMGQLTKEINDQEDAYQRLNKAQNQRNRRLAVGGALLGAAAAGGAALVGAFKSEIEELRELRQVSFETGIAVEQLGAIATQARDFFPGIDAGTVADRIGQAQRELELRLQEDNPEAQILRGLVGDAGSLHDQFISILEQATQVDDPAAFLDRALGGTEGEVFAGLARSGDLEAFIGATRNVDTALAEQFRAMEEANNSVRELNQAFGDMKQTLVGALAPALTVGAALFGSFVGPIANLIKENKGLAQVLGVTLVAGIVALTIAGGLFLLGVVGPLIAGGIAVIVAWFPIIAIIVGVGLAIAGVIYLLNKLGVINIDTSGVEKGFRDIRSSVDLDAVRGAQSRGGTSVGDTTINNYQTNNIEALGDGEEIAERVGDETSRAIHQSIHIRRR